MLYSFQWNYPYLYRTYTLLLINLNRKDMGIKEIEVEIQKLELKERATLAKWIVESLDNLSEAEVDALWTE